jgi:hypothetical protein
VLRPSWSRREGNVRLVEHTRGAAYIVLFLYVQAESEHEGWYGWFCAFFLENLMEKYHLIGLRIYEKTLLKGAFKK